MFTRFARLALIVVFLGQLVLGAFSASAQERITDTKAQPEQATVDSVRNTRDIESATATLNYRYTYQLGHRYTYSWKLDVTTLGNVATETATTSQQDTFEVAANVEVVPVQQFTDGRYILQLQLRDPHAWVNVEDPTTGSVVREETMTYDLRSALLKPFYYVQQTSGNIVQIFFASDDMEASQNIKRGIVDSLQVQINDKAASSVQEQGPNGLATTHYNQTSVGRSLSISKTRSAADYVRFADPTVGNTPMVIDEEMSAEYDLALGTVRAVKYASYLATPSETGAITGANEQAINSSIMSSGSLQLVQVSTAPISELLPVISPRASTEDIKQTLQTTWNTSYAEGGLVASYSPSLPTVDPDFNVRIALAAMAAEPSEYTPIGKLIDLLTAQPAALRELRVMLEQTQVDQQLYPNVAAALAQVGTSDAQAVLIDTMINNAGLAAELRLEALNALVGVHAPSTQTIELLQKFASDPSDVFFAQSTLLLGTFAHRLAENNPNQASMLVDNLVVALATTNDESLIELYLHALGNAGAPQTLGVIEGYLNHQSSFIRLAALDALRKLPVEKIADLLLKASTDSNPAIARSAEGLVIDKLAQEPTASKMNAVPLWNWDRKIGKGDIYALLAAKIEASKVNGQLHLYGSAWVNIHLWKVHKNEVVKARALSEVFTQNNVSKRRFGIYLFVMGEKVASKEYEMKCGETKSAYLIDKTYTFLNVPYSFWVYGIKVKFSVKVGGRVSVWWSYGYNACTPTNSQAFVSIIPGTNITAEAGASVDIGLFKAGISVQGQFLNTSLPTTLTASLQGTQLKGCLNMGLYFQAVKIRIYGWYKWWRLFKGKWGYKEKTFWSESYGSYNQQLFNNCITS